MTATMTNSLTTAQLQKIIARWDDGSGVTAAVQAFARAVPVKERTVWYWLAGRKMHPVFEGRVRQMGNTTSKEAI